MSDKITPQLVLDKAIDHCTAITGGGFPISLYPSKIANANLGCTRHSWSKLRSALVCTGCQRIIREVNVCYGFPKKPINLKMIWRHYQQVERETFCRNDALCMIQAILHSEFFGNSR